MFNTHMGRGEKFLKKLRVVYIQKGNSWIQSTGFKSLPIGSLDPLFYIWDNLNPPFGFLSAFQYLFLMDVVHLR